MQRHTGNGQFSDRLFSCSILRFVPILPYIPSIKGCKKIIDINAEIGIQARLDSKQKYKLPASQYLPATNKHSPDILTTDKAIRQKFRKFPDSPHESTMIYKKTSKHLKLLKARLIFRQGNIIERNFQIRLEQNSNRPLFFEVFIFHFLSRSSYRTYRCRFGR